MFPPEGDWNTCGGELLSETIGLDIGLAMPALGWVTGVLISS